jgi:arabinose-5-phosphate isomerase
MKENSLEKRNILAQAEAVLKIEAQGILDLISRLNDNFVKMVELIYRCKGRLIVGGIGKSGVVARKIVATLNSTGTRALFLHPVEAMHGDIGMVSSGDIFLALSNSGETDELNILIPSMKKIGCAVIAMTGNMQSTLALHSDIAIDVGVKQEACPMGLAPTASTTAQLAMGDALAVVLINIKKFNSTDFKRSHPGGILGRRLQSKVEDMMLTGRAIPKTAENGSMEDAIDEMNRLQLGVTLIVAADGTLAGILTDGDLRRLIKKKKDIFSLSIQQVMTRTPRTLLPDCPAYDALNIMEQYQITILPILDVQGRVKGILHLHDILGKGEFKFNGKMEKIKNCYEQRTN